MRFSNALLLVPLSLNLCACVATRQIVVNSSAVAQYIAGLLQTSPGGGIGASFSVGAKDTVDMSTAPNGTGTVTSGCITVGNMDDIMNDINFTVAISNKASYSGVVTYDPTNPGQPGEGCVKIPAGDPGNSFVAGDTISLSISVNSCADQDDPVSPPYSPVCKMPYCGGTPPFAANFDCDDFAQTFCTWAEAKGYTVWQLIITDSNTNTSHALNILKMRYGPCDENRFCLVDPTAGAGGSNGTTSDPSLCWVQAAGDPAVPAWVMANYNNLYGRAWAVVEIVAGCANQGTVVEWCYKPGSGYWFWETEPSFNCDANLSSQFTTATGLDPVTCKPTTGH